MINACVVLVLDYMDRQCVHEYSNYASCVEQLPSKRLFACSTKGKSCYAEARFQTDDAFLFGPETRGLPDNILSGFSAEAILRIPMLPNSRSLNLSNTVAICLYEAWRQIGFTNAI